MRRLIAFPRLLTFAGLLTLGACALFAPDQRYLVFFQEYSAQLDAPARQTIDGAAGWAKDHPLQPVHVVGFADPIGSPQASSELSALRAKVVSDALIADGLPAGRITVESRGATKYELSSQESRRVVIEMGTP
jgi:outer membrane protein OmpA-like peptidoglycan-associated protein